MHYWDFGFSNRSSICVYFVSSSDGVVCVWDLVFPSSSEADCKLSSLETLSIVSKPMVALSLSEFPGSIGRLILSMGGLDNKIHLYCGERTGNFRHACELKWHTDWIRNLDLSLPISENDEIPSLLLASSFQDEGIRIWKLGLRNAPANSNGLEEISLSSYIEGPVFLAGSSSYQISLESLLIGHKDWVYTQLNGNLQ